jgi:hypothetical protein
VREEASLLGARFGPLFGAGGATSHEAHVAARVDLAPGWSLGGEWTGLIARPDRAGLISGGQLYARAVSVDLAAAGLLWGRDRLSLRYAEPLRVTGGALRIDLPLAHDAFTGRTEFGTRALSLSPAGRERVMEAAYVLPLGDARLSLNSWWRRDPGHFSALDDDMGGAIRFTLGY